MIRTTYNSNVVCHHYYYDSLSSVATVVDRSVLVMFTPPPLPPSSHLYLYPYRAHTYLCFYRPSPIVHHLYLCHTSTQLQDYPSYIGCALTAYTSPLSCMTHHLSCMTHHLSCMTHHQPYHMTHHNCMEILWNEPHIMSGSV